MLLTILSFLKEKFIFAFIHHLNGYKIYVGRCISRVDLSVVYNKIEKINNKSIDLDCRNLSLTLLIRNRKPNIHCCVRLKYGLVFAPG